MYAEIVQQLWAASIAASAAIVLMLTIRKSVRVRLGAEVAYWIWVVVPLAAVAAMLPAFHGDNALGGAIPRLPVVVAQAPAVAVDANPSVVLVFLWACGVVSSIALLIAQQRRYVRGLQLLDDRAEWSAGIPLLRAADRRAGPAVIGAMRMRIVLPVDFEARYSADQRDLILAHEMMHIRRRDGMSNALLAALRAAFWFNPLMHYAARRFRFDQELACDAAVMRQAPGTRRVYADAILNTQLADTGLPVGCHWQSSHPLKERILMLKQHDVSNPRRRIGMFAVAALVGTFTFAAHSAQPPSHAAAGHPSADIDASYAAMKLPEYPAALVQAHIEGVVQVRALIGADGSVKQAMAETSPPSPDALHPIAVAAVKSWRFNPAKHNGKPIESWVRIPISFQLDPNPDPGTSYDPKALDTIQVSAAR